MVPLIYDASLEAKNVHTDAISSGRANRDKKIRAISFSRSHGGSVSLSVVSTHPGAIPLTRIRLSRSASERFFTSIFIAAFELS